MFSLNLANNTFLECTMPMDMCEYGIGVKDCLTYYQDTNKEIAEELQKRIEVATVKYSKKE